MSLRKRIVLPIARRYIGGETIEELVQQGKTLNRAGFKLIANFLGEEVSVAEQARENTEEYVRLVDVLDKNQISGSISIKPTQLGLSISEELASRNLGALLERAVGSNRFLWIDMESSAYTDSTLKIYSSLLPNFPNIGIAIQAYMKRSQSDLRTLLDMGGQVRVVKGAYNESDSIAFRNRKQVRLNYAEILRTLFNQRNFFSIATHDEFLLKQAISLVAETKNENFEFQLLKGVREERARRLLNNGFKVSIYVPYGHSWLPYSVRRMRESRSNTFFILRAILRL